MDHVTLNSENNMSTDAVFLDIENAFETTWQLGFLYKLSELKFSVSLIKLISSFLFQRKFRVLVDGEMSTPRDIQGVPQGSVLTPTLYNMYINDTPHTPRVYQGLFANDTCIYATDGKEGYVLRKLQQAYEHWNKKTMKIRLGQSTFLIDLGPLRLILH
jgi:hypothetical protein